MLKQHAADAAANAATARPKQVRLQQPASDVPMESRVRHLFSGLRAFAKSDDESAASGLKIILATMEAGKVAAAVAANGKKHMIDKRRAATPVLIEDVVKRDHGAEGFSVRIPLSIGPDQTPETVWTSEVQRVVENQFLAQYLEHLGVSCTPTNIQHLRRDMLERNRHCLQHRFWWRSHGWNADAVQLTYSRKASVLPLPAPSLPSPLTTSPTATTRRRTTSTTLRSSTRASFLPARPSAACGVSAASRWRKVKSSHLTVSALETMRAAEWRKSRMERVFHNCSGGTAKPMPPSKTNPVRFRCLQNFATANRFSDRQRFAGEFHDCRMFDQFEYANTGASSSGIGGKSPTTAVPSMKAPRGEVNRVVRLFLLIVPIKQFPLYGEAALEELSKIMTQATMTDLISLLAHFLFWQIIQEEDRSDAIVRTQELTFAQVVRTWAVVQRAIKGSEHASLFIMPLVLDGIICVIECLFEFSIAERFATVAQRNTMYNAIRDRLLAILAPIQSTSSDCPLSSTPRSTKSASPAVYLRQRARQRIVQTACGERWESMPRLLNATSPFLHAVIPHVANPKTRSFLLRGPKQHPLAACPIHLPASSITHPPHSTRSGRRSPSLTRQRSPSLTRRAPPSTSRPG